MAIAVPSSLPSLPSLPLPWLNLHHHPPGSYSTWTCTEKAADTFSFLPPLLSVSMSAASCFVVLFRAPSRLSGPDPDPLPTPLPTPRALLWLSFPHSSLVLVTGLLLWPKPWPMLSHSQTDFSLSYLPFCFLKRFSSITSFLHTLFALFLLASSLLKPQPLVF